MATMTSNQASNIAYGAAIKYGGTQVGTITTFNNLADAIKAQSEYGGTINGNSVDFMQPIPSQSGLSTITIVILVAVVIGGIYFMEKK